MSLEMVPLVETSAQAIYWLVTFVIAGLVWWRGDRPERIGVLIVLAGFVFSGLVDEIYWGRVHGLVVLADGALFAGFYALSLKYARWWIRGAAAFALLGFLSHFATLFDSSVMTWAYVTMIWLTSAGILLALLASTAEVPFARRYETWLRQGRS